MAITRITNIANTIPDASIANEKLSDIVNFKNIIINGDMSIAQRGTSVSGITSGGYYTLDRFNFNMVTMGTWTMSQDSDVPTGQGFAKSLKLDCTTADASPSAGDRLRIMQAIEGQNLQYLKYATANAESLTLSFWVKSNKTGTYNASFYNDNVVRYISKSYTINSADTWEKKTITYAGDTVGSIGNTNTNILQLQMWFGAGSNFTSGTLATSWEAETASNMAVGQVNLADATSNYINITGVQLEAGDTASEFEFLPVDVNLERCLRYLQFIDAEYFIVARWDNNAGNPIGQLNFLKTMRAAPTASAIGTFSTGAGYAGTPSFNNIQTVCLAPSGADSISANSIRYLHNGLFKMESEL